VSNSLPSAFALTALSAGLGLGETAMPPSKTYQRYAARCLEEARNTTDPEKRTFFAEMAKEWERLAREAGVNGEQASTPDLEDRGD
jgi:hypothetical protein